MIRPTATLLGEDARKAIFSGVMSVYDPVGRTLGPQGKNALLYRTYNRGPRITNDGWTVGEVQEPKNQFERIVNNAFKEACRRTNEKVGDGTTTTVVIAGKAYLDLHAKMVRGGSAMAGATGAGAMTLRKKILESARNIKEKILTAKKYINTLEELEKIATVSVEDPELGKIIAKMAWEVGVDGFIDVVEGYKGEIETEVIKGFRFPAKVPAKGFLNNVARFEMVATGCSVLITNYELDNLKQAVDLISPLIVTEKISKLIVVAPKFSNRVLDEFYKLNFTSEGGLKVKTNYDVFPVATPSLRADQYEDLAIYCDAKFFDKLKGQKLVGVRAADLGYLDKLVVKDVEAREDAIATGGRGAVEREMIVETETEKEVRRGKEKVMKKEKEMVGKIASRVAERIEVLKGQLVETQQIEFKKLLERRIASMSSAVGVIRVGDSTQASSLYRKLKIEDAVFASKAALRSGYVEGGGLCLKKIADDLPEDDVLKGAITEPYAKIQASVEGGIEITRDIIDPAEVPLYAVEHAAGVVAHLITVDVITVELEDPVHGEGEYAIARAMNEQVIAYKRHKGLITENEEEMERDMLNGLTWHEKDVLDNG